MNNAVFLSLDHPMLQHYREWQTASREANKVLQSVKDDVEHPAYQKAQQEENETLYTFLTVETESLHGVLLKLKLACHYEGCVAEAIDPRNHYVASRALVAAIADLEGILFEYGNIAR